VRWWALEVVVGWRCGVERSGAGAVVPPVVWAACWSGGDGFGSASAVFVDGDAVHREGKADEVEVLSGVSDGVGPPEPEGVVEVAVDGLGVVTSGVEPSEIGICWWDGSDVLGAVEAPSLVFVVGVESDGDGSAVGPVGESVVVVPPELVVFAGVAMGAYSGERNELEVAGVNETADTDVTAAGVEVDGADGAVGVADSFGLDPHGFVLPLSVGVSTRLVGSGLLGGDSVDRQPAQITEESLVMDAA
jgi:hypothetical protein